MAFLISDSLELAGAPLWHLGTHRPPDGRLVPLSRGRSAYVREVAPTGPKRSRKASPPVLLLHGWFASGGLNWIRAFPALRKGYRVCAPDLLGHAGCDVSRSTPRTAERSTGRFEIERCADDMAELLELLYPGEPALVVGYSLGGMVAQALWRRHPDSVAGLVLGATSAAPVPVSRGRLPFAGLMNAARESSALFDRMTRGPKSLAQAVAAALPHPLSNPERSGMGALPLGHWAPNEFAGHHWPTVLDAGRAIAEFDARDWVGKVDVPTSVLLTKRDSLIPPEQQRAMLAAIGHADVQVIDSGHFACVREDFGQRLKKACRTVETALA